MKEENKKELGAGRVAFLARLPAIKEGIETGRTVMSVYREFGKQIGIGYSQFDRYVIKYIRSKPDGNEGKKTTPAKETTVVRTRTSDQPAFVSSATPRDDLIHPKPKG